MMFISGIDNWLFDLTPLAGCCLHSSWKFLKLRISIIHQTSHSMMMMDDSSPPQAYTLSHNESGKNEQNRGKIRNLQRSSFPSSSNKPNNPHHQQIPISLPFCSHWFSFVQISLPFFHFLNPHVMCCTPPAKHRAMHNKIFSVCDQRGFNII